MRENNNNLILNCYCYPNICYILIIPAFGIVSHVISTFSGKPIFGQDGPLNNIVFNYLTAAHYVREQKIILYCTRITLLLTVFSHFD